MNDMTQDRDAAPALPVPPSNMNQLVDQYVKLRDKIKVADDAHKTKLKPAREYLALLESKLMDQLNQIGGDSVKTPHGTAYRTTRRSATIADGKVFRDYVIANAEFDLVDWKANATAVDDHIKNNQVPPPGVNFVTAFTVGVRRA